MVRLCSLLRKSFVFHSAALKLNTGLFHYNKIERIRDLKGYDNGRKINVLPQTIIKHKKVSKGFKLMNDIMCYISFSSTWIGRFTQLNSNSHINVVFISSLSYLIEWGGGMHCNHLVINAQMALRIWISK